jgi:hypothetical protein
MSVTNGLPGKRMGKKRMTAKVVLVQNVASIGLAPGLQEEKKKKRRRVKKKKKACLYI